MICRECADSNQKSNVTGGPGHQTLMYCPPFWDENGVRHSHDRNWTTRHYTCSNGHNWSTSEQGKCPVIDCEWNQERQTR